MNDKVAVPVSTRYKIQTRAKKVGCFTLFFTSIFLFCAGLCGIMWAGGWLKKYTCGIVLSDSFIAKEIDCDIDERVETVSDIDQGDVIDIQVPENTATTEELVTHIIEEASPGVVTITINTSTFDEEQGLIDEPSNIGSGFVVKSDGIIITNQHVVSERDAEYSVILPGEDTAIAVEEIHRDSINDLAILRVDRDGLKALKLGDSDELKRGNLTIAIGNPFGDLEGTATVGFVTGLNREVSAQSSFFGSVTQYEGVIQTDAAINPGNSGGPLLNSKGQVIGVNFATTRGADNVSFAIPSSRVADLLAIFEREGRIPQPYIGISYSQRTLSIQNEVIVGAVILEVESEGPAQEAGLRRGDIVLEADEKSLETDNLATIIQSKKVGQTMSLMVWRDGETLEINVVVGDREE